MDKYQKADQDWLDCMCRIGRKELGFFEENSEGYTEELIFFNCRRSLMIWIYDTLRSRGKITPIEKLDHETKKQMWLFVLDVCKGRMNDLKKMKDIAKVFYTLEYFLNETAPT